MLFTPIKPILLNIGRKIKNNPGHLFDIKWDGWRILIHKQGNRIEVYTRHGKSII